MSPPVAAVKLNAFEILFALIAVPFRYNSLADSTCVPDSKTTYHSLQVPYSAPHNPNGTIPSHSCHRHSQPLPRSWARRSSSTVPVQVHPLPLLHPALKSLRRLALLLPLLSELPGPLLSYGIA